MTIKLLHYTIFMQPGGNNALDIRGLSARNEDNGWSML